MRRASAAACALAISLGSAAAFADPGSDADHTETARAPRDVRSEAPILAYTYRAGGVSGRSIGVEAYGTAHAGSGQDSAAGGGAILYGSPVDRLTLVGDFARDFSGRFAPSAAGIVRVYGQSGRGLSLGALVKYKVEGFSTGAEGEFESEVEGGFLASYDARGWHVDANAIGGVGLTDEGEVDVEGRLRLGRDIDDHIRVGLDGQFRGRAHGNTLLAGGRTWDFASGGQLLAGYGHFYGSVTAGPSTTEIVKDVGFAAFLTFGATSF